MSKSKKMFVGIDTNKNSRQVSFLNPTKVKKDLRIENNREGFDQLTDRLQTYRKEGYQLKWLVNLPVITGKTWDATLKKSDLR